MAKSNPLAQGLERISQPVPTVQPTTPIARRAPTAVPRRAPSREGQSLVGGFFSPEVHRQLKILAAESGSTQQALLTEALDMLFAKHGKPEIAGLGRPQKANA